MDQKHSSPARLSKTSTFETCPNIMDTAKDTCIIISLKQEPADNYTNVQ